MKCAERLENIGKFTANKLQSQWEGSFEMGECLTIVWLIEITANVLILRHAGRH